MPGHRRVARRAAGEDRLLERVQAARRLVGRAAAVLTPARRRVLLAAAVGVARRQLLRLVESLWDASLWWDVGLLARAHPGRVLRSSTSRCRCRTPALGAAARARARARHLGARRGRPGRGRQLLKLAAATAARLLVRQACSRRVGLVVARRLPDPLGGRLLGLARADVRTSSRTIRTCSRPSRSRSHPRRERRGAARAAGHPLLRTLPGRRRPLRAARLLDLARRWRCRSAPRWRSRSAPTSAACPALPGLSIGVPGR